MNACRSRLSIIARRSSALSNGGLSRLTSMCVVTLVGSMAHIAFGAFFFTSLSSGGVTSAVCVRSNSPAAKARRRVERLGTMRHSIASR